MELVYHKGNNFGDALNPLIFEHLLGKDFFDEDDSLQFLAIGSILGLKKKGGKKIVFSSGYADGADDTYGSPPIIDSSYEIICVRGEKTAKKLNIDINKAVADGAILITELPLEPVEVKHEVSFIPHYKSLEFYSQWKNLCSEIGINLIDPRDDIFFVLNEIRSSKLILAEAMHGAIVADAFRIPWIPTQFYPHINSFKWQDWCESMLLNYKPLICKAYLHDESFFIKILAEKRPYIPNSLAKLIVKFIIKYRKSKVKDFLKEASNGMPILSSLSILEDKKRTLLQLLSNFKKQYSKSGAVIK